MSNNSSTADGYDGYYILLFRLILWGYVGMVLSLFGIVGNIITILVLISPSMRTTSTNIYLTALSCSNILFLLIFIPSYSMRYLIGFPLYITDQPPFALEILLSRLPTTPVYNTILLSIIYLTIAVSMDRLILVKFPLKAKQILTPRTTLIAILLIYIFSILYCIPYWLEQRYDPVHKRCQLTEIGKKIHIYIRIYIYIPVVYLFPFVVLTCINITIIQSLVAKKRRKKSLCANMSKKKQGDYHITLMLVMVIIVFVLCQLPLSILNAWHAIDAEHANVSLIFHSINSLGVLLTVFNTSTNFLLYCFFGQKFRQTLIEFVFHFFPNYQKRSSVQTRTSRLSDKTTINNLPISLQRSEQNPRISVTVPTPTVTTTSTSNEFRKSTELNHLSHINPTNCLEESTPLILPSEQISIVNEHTPFQSSPNLNLYTCANGKRILVLKI